MAANGNGTFVNDANNPNSSRRGSAGSIATNLTDDFDNIPNVTHDCTRHEILPPTEADGFYALYPFSYRGWQLLGRSRTIRHMNRTIEQQHLEYNFLRRYFKADIEKLSEYRLHCLIWGWMDILDSYFFGRTLTTNEQHILDLTLRETAPYHAANRTGITFPDFRDFPDNLNMFTTIYRSEDGVRRNKLQLMETVIHEMVHAYLETFYDRCPAENNGPVYLKGPDKDGHGELFYSVFEETLARVRMWHNDLATLGLNHRERLPQQTLVKKIRDRYIGLLATNPRLLKEWDDDGRFIRTHPLIRWPVTANLQRKYEDHYINLVFARKTDLKIIVTTEAIWSQAFILIYILVALLILYLLVSFALYIR